MEVGVRRYARTLVVISVLLVLAVAALGFRTINIGNFERGSDETVLGLKLGLDLQGGSDLVYRAALVDPVTGLRVAPTAEQMASVQTTIERRINTSGLGVPTIQILGEDRLLIQLPGVRDPARAKSIIGETARLEFKHRKLGATSDLPGLSGDNIVSVKVTTWTDVQKMVLDLAVPSTSTTSTPPIATTTQATTTLPSFETATPETSTGTTTPPGSSATSTATSTEALLGVETGTAALIIEFTESAAERFVDLLARLDASLEPTPGARALFPSALSVSVAGEAFAPLEMTTYPVFQTGEGAVAFTEELGGVSSILRIGGTTAFALNLAATGTDLDRAKERYSATSTLRLQEVQGKLDEDIGLTGEDLERAYPSQHQGTGLPIINIEFNPEGTKKFGELTASIAGTPDSIAIFLDDEELIAPTVRQAIFGGAAYIEGRDFTFDRVRDISLLLESGRLPIPIELIQERDVDAILGADSLKKSVVAGLVGLSLVLLFMVLYYRAPGAVAALALVIYAALVLAIFKILPVTLTLSGVAAAILSIGMAVDANILIFERMKEELRAGRTLLSAVNLGFNRAWPAIRDSNVSTLITCAILFWFADTLGATIVQGFAITLAIGVAISMFSAITVSRTLLRLTADTPLGRRLGMFLPAGKAELPQQQGEATPA